MKSAYIHIPFCSSICSYCDFSKMLYNKTLVTNYLLELEEEIKSNYKGEILDTIYLGGGTPSTLDIKELRQLFELLKILKHNKDFEFTIECNVENLNEEKIKLFKEYGINRVSLGIQTFNEKFLQFLNRKHNTEEVKNIINTLKKHNINNINVDLIYAIPGQTLEDLKEDLKIFLSLDIPHISTYSLIIEEHTVLHNKKIENIDEDLDFMMYTEIIKTLYNYEHYEVSNFALQGFASRHNLTYWDNSHYYGFGLGASGYIGNIRYDNTRSINKYLKKEYIKEKQTLTKNETIENEFILGLRKTKGLNKENFKKKYNIEIKEIETIKKLIEEKKLIEDQENIYINPDYIYVSNNILIDFLGVKYETSNI
ncbi:MAG: radical SAM family heme chaperone HemW [Bacilli bacterium]